MTTTAWWIAIGVVVTVNVLYVGFGILWRRHELADAVFNGLDNALENGYFELGEQLHAASPDEIAYDMQAYADCGDYTVAELRPYVRKWLKKRGRRWQDA